MNTNQPELQQLLIDCLKTDGTIVDRSRLSRLSSDAWQSLLGLAAEQRVKPLFWHRLKEKELVNALPVHVAENLKESLQLNTMRNLRRYGELRNLMSRLNAEKIPLVLLKGIFLAETVYGNMGLREMNDIDLLARPEDLIRIADILTGLGYTPLHTISAEVTLQTCHHLPPLIKAGHASFEIHWNLMGPDKSEKVDPAVFWQHVVPVQIAGQQSLSLSPEDLLLHLCYHTSYHHGFAFGLRPSCDIAATISHFGSKLDWQIIFERTISNDWQRGVYLALYLARELAGAEVPKEVLERLQPTGMTSSIIEVTRQQVFSDKTITNVITPYFAELLENRSIFDKLRVFRQRIFLPKAMIASLYPVPIDSIRIYGYYLYRIFDLLFRHGNNMKKYHHNDGQLSGIVERTNTITNWLHQR